MDDGEDDYGEFTDNEVEDLFDFELDEIELGETIFELDEPNLNPPRKALFAENQVEVSFPQKKRFFEPVYYSFRVIYSAIKAYD
ncbi:MAG: hypothetical protein ACTSQY_06905, partial [Candidatus Odinarchaeia archaeon]